MIVLFVFFWGNEDTSVADQWFTVDDAQTFNTARRLIRDEGLLCGGSSGANMAAALALAKDLGRHQKCVVLLPDGVRNYMTKVGAQRGDF